MFWQSILKNLGIDPKDRIPLVLSWCFIAHSIFWLVLLSWFTLECQGQPFTLVLTKGLMIHADLCLLLGCILLQMHLKIEVLMVG
jgi:hypothetical protein